MNTLRNSVSLFALWLSMLLPLVGAQAQVARPQMQIVAHEDDDILFMNPDLENNFQVGVGMITVYLTAGEANGAPGMCRDTFATARQHGIQAAYARMASRGRIRPIPNVWTRELIVPDIGVPWPHTVERYTLAGLPRIQLIFMNIRDDGDPEPPLHATSFMFSDPTYVTNTIVPSCGPLATCVHSPSCGPDVPWQNYTHADVVNVLSG